MRTKFISCSLVIISLIIPLFLFSYTAYNSYGYDDEYFNVAHLANYSSACELVRDHLSGKLLDIHPLGQYLINYVLIKLLGSWSLVRVAGAIIAALSLWLFWRYSTCRRKYGILSLLLSYVLICLNPSAMLWCTSIRWYTYFLPLVCIIGVLFNPPEMLNKHKYLFWGIYFSVVSVMYYIETSSAVLIMVSFILLLIQRRTLLKYEYTAVFCYGILSLLAVSRQIYLFITVLYPSVSGSGEFSSLLISFVGGGQNFLSGHAVIPVSISGMILITANFMIFISFIMNFKYVASDWQHKFFVLSYVGLILSKIGGKIRNFIGLAALQEDFVADIFSQIRSKKLKVAILALYCAGTLLGIHNVISHTDTIKGSWNTPYRELIDFLEEYDSARKYTVVSHNPVFSHHAELRGFSVIRADTDQEWLDKLQKLNGTVIMLRTFRGSLPAEKFEKFNSYISSRKITLEQKFGYDRFASFKRLFDKDYPDYYAVIVVTE